MRAILVVLAKVVTALSDCIIQCWRTASSLLAVVAIDDRELITVIQYTLCRRGSRAIVAAAEPRMRQDPQDPCSQLLMV
jgi:hypothetical protein